MKVKDKMTQPVAKWKPLPNEAHRIEKWSGGRIHRNKKAYTRKGKNKNLPFDTERSKSCQP